MIRWALLLLVVLAGCAGYPREVRGRVVIKHALNGRHYLVLHTGGGRGEMVEVTAAEWRRAEFGRCRTGRASRPWPYPVPEYVAGAERWRRPCGKEDAP